jgi:hypothetical protein
MSTATVRRSIRAAFAFALLSISPFLDEGAQAQPSLNFKRVINTWPTIQLHFSVACSGQPAVVTDKSYFRVVEDGLEIGQFDLWCPDPTVRCAMSTSLVFDASGSMAGAGNAGVKAAGNAFVDMMDGVADEAAVLWFNTSVNVQQGMTTSNDQLHVAINALPASGSTAVWDGIYLGVLELINNGVNQCRAVIVVTDGEDNSSSRTPSEIVALANQNGIRVFTVSLGGPVNSAQLQAIANLTGGHCYETPSVSQLVPIYQEIATIILQGFQECRITYTATCMDGSIRPVDLTLRNFCGGSDTKTKSYMALHDTSTYSPLAFGIGTASARGGANVAVPLQLRDTIPAGSILHPATFTLLFDTACAHYVSIATPPGTLLAGSPVTVAPIAGGIVISTVDKKYFPSPQAPATLAELTFRAGDPEGTDTLRCALDLADCVLSAGCFRPVPVDGAIAIVPRQPDVSCTISAPPFLSWVRAQKDYSPNPFTVGMTLSNMGDREARNARFKIIYSKSDLSLVAPLNDTQLGTPRNVDPAGLSEARWDVMAKRRLVGDSIEVCIEASFDNYYTMICCLHIWIPPSDPVLECSVSAPIIRNDPVTQRYNPMPFSVDVSVTNTGGRKTDTVFATITVPKDLVLYGPDAPDKHTKRILPSMLSPGQQGGTSWTLWHPVTMIPKTYTIRVCVKTANADSTCCEVQVVIPAINAPVLDARCSAPDSLHYDRAAGVYLPNPFQVSLACVNRGGSPASNVTGFIYLPANVEFVDPLETPRKTFNPSTMDEYKGGPIPTLTWLVRYTKKLRYDSCLDFRFVVGGLGPTGMPTDSVESWCRVCVPGMRPAYACSIEMPDSLALNTAGTDVEPNPFTVTYKVWNIGDNTGTIDLADLLIPAGEDLTLDPSTPTPVTLHRTLAPGDTVTVRWRVAAANRMTRRLVTITATAFDDEANPIQCVAVLPIANLRAAMTCNAAVSDTVIAYDPVAQRYTPSTWTITGTLTNISAAPLSNIIAEIALLDSTLAPYAAFDPDPARDNSNPKTLALLPAQSSRAFTWHFTVASPDTTGAPVYPAFAIRYGSDQTPRTTSGCSAWVEIQPVRTVSMYCIAHVSDSVIAYDPATKTYSPTTWMVYGALYNDGTAPLTNLTAEIALADSSLARYVMFDPDPTLDNTNPKTLPALAPSANASFTWYFALAEPDTTGASVFPEFTIRYGSTEIPVVGNGCAALIEIQPAITVGVEGPSAAASGLELFPDPSNGLITLRVPARPGEAVRIAVLDMLGRELLRSEGVSASGEYQAALRLAPATPGTYFLHVTSGERRWVRSLRVY